MNTLTFAEFQERLIQRARLLTRLLDLSRRATVFSSRHEADAITRIYVVNLDRRPDRWQRVRRELGRFRDRHGEHLTTLVRRLSAVDARHMVGDPDPGVLRPSYSLADQLTVDPNPLLSINEDTRAHQIAMSRQEVAVALSHIAAWRRVATGTDRAALILEDDVALMAGFARGLTATWNSLQDAASAPDFDLLYLAYKDVSGERRVRQANARRRRRPGLWEAAGYVLTKSGAQKLLDQLPVFGPVDLWLNLQFEIVRTYTSSRPLIVQRVDEPSTNSYSIMPVLSQVGVLTREKALPPPNQRLPGPVIGIGAAGSGLTALARALSMIGYSCLSDLANWPSAELDSLRNGQSDASFNAYVNVGSMDCKALRQIALVNPGVRFIRTSSAVQVPKGRLLDLGVEVQDKWEALSDFLGVDYPPFDYPDSVELGQRLRALPTPLESPLTVTDLRSDTSPWIARRHVSGRRGVSLQAEERGLSADVSIKWSPGEPLDPQDLACRSDTFPSNLALFTPRNVDVGDEYITLAMRQESTPVRDFTAAAIASRSRHRYGSFAAELRPSNVSGLITGLFLHRNGPRQEIDIEFVGRDTTKMLVNVFFNPGPPGTKLEFGYRGTPTAIDLGFDAAEGFHLYEIDWQPHRIDWLVDGAIVYRRHLWDPTPIPDCPLEFNINLWHSRSSEFGGRLDRSRLPASAHIRSIAITSSSSP